MALVEETCIEFILGGEGVHRECPLCSCQEIVFLESEAIGAVGKGDIHHFCIFLGLLHTMADGMVGVFGFDDGNGGGAVVVEQIIGVFGFATGNEVASQVDLAIGKFDLCLHGDILNRPTLIRYCWCNVPQLDVFLTQLIVFRSRYLHCHSLVRVYDAKLRSFSETAKLFEEKS